MPCLSVRCRTSLLHRRPRSERRTGPGGRGPPVDFGRYLVLFHGIGDGLACKPVLELQRSRWGGRSRTERCPSDSCWLLVLYLSCRVTENRFCRYRSSAWVLPGGWGSVEERYLVRSVLDTLPEYVNDAAVAYLPFEAVQEPSSRGGICVQGQCSRCFRLGSREEGGEVAEVDAVGAFVVLRDRRGATHCWLVSW